MSIGVTIDRLPLPTSTKFAGHMLQPLPDGHVGDDKRDRGQSIGHSAWAVDCLVAAVGYRQVHPNRRVVDLGTRDRVRLGRAHCRRSVSRILLGVTAFCASVRDVPARSQPGKDSVRTGGQDVMPAIGRVRCVPISLPKSEASPKATTPRRSRPASSRGAPDGRCRRRLPRPGTPEPNKGHEPWNGASPKLKTSPSLPTSQ